MKSRTGLLLVAAVALLLLSPAGASGAGLRSWMRGPHHTDTFSLSTEYTGYLSGSLMINLVTYPVADDAAVYVIGEGAVPLGMMVVGRSIYVAGERHGKNYLIRTIVVRPSAESVETDDSKPVVGVVSDSAPPM